MVTALIGASPHPALAAESQAALAHKHDEAVRQARAGDPAGALVVLDRLAAEAPDDLGIARDRIVVASWAGSDAKAVALYDALAPGEQPVYVIEAVADAERRLGRMQAALPLYRQGRARAPANPNLAAGEIETLIALADVAEARRLADEFGAEHGDAPAVLLAGADAASAARSPIDALRFIDRTLKKDPGNRDAARRRILAIEEIGAPDVALDFARQRPDLLTAAERRHLEASAAAELVRWDSLEPASQAERFAATDRAIAALDKLIADWQQEREIAAGDLMRARLDRLVALHDRYRMAEVVAEYEQYVRAGTALPDYILPSVAGAYLYLHQPETARDLYRRALVADPKNVAAQIGLYYALVDTDELDKAQAQIDAIAAALSPWIYLKGGHEPIPNPDKLTADLAAANARVSADDLPEAQRRLDALSDAAPANVEARVARASVYEARGWPRRASDELAIAHTDAPDDPDTALAQADVDLAMNDWRQSESEIGALDQEYPESLEAQRLARAWDAHQRPELQIFADRAFRSSTNVTGGAGYLVGDRLYSPPFLYDWRAFAGQSLAHDSFIEGKLTERVYDAGLEYRDRALTASVDSRLVNYGPTHGGIGANADWQISDQWQVGGGGEIFSPDTPLRALRNGITADSASLHLDDRASEAQDLQLAAEGLTFSDGNLRTALSVIERARLYTAPHLQLDGIGEVAASANSRTMAPYFNPRRDTLATVGVEATQILYRRYEFTYEHQVTLTTGPYWEQNFGTGLAWNVRYSQTVRQGSAFDASVGAGVGRQAYDGNYETDLDLTFNLTWRF